MRTSGSSASSGLGRAAFGLPALVFLVVGLLLGACGRPAAPGEPALVIISFDGFRPDYLERFDTPNLDRLAADGVRAEYLIPSSPTTAWRTRRPTRW